MNEKALTLKEAADILGVSYQTVFHRRHQIGFRPLGSRAWRVWPSKLAEYSKPRNNLTRISLRVNGKEDPCQLKNTRNQESGGSTSHRQAAKELDALLALG